jgi:hypothetical protein
LEVDAVVGGVACLALIIGLAACGDDDDDATVTVTHESEASATDADQSSEAEFIRKADEICERLNWVNRPYTRVAIPPRGKHLDLRPPAGANSDGSRARASPSLIPDGRV